MDNYFGNVKYRKGMLNVLDDSVRDHFSLSSPSKISLSKGRAFSLPAGPEFSCPGATGACVDCYAQKGRHHFVNVKKMFAANWNLFQSFEKKKDLVGCAIELCKVIPKTGIFRIFESGDFSSQFAVNVWALVAQSNPKVDFYAYTRSFHLNYEPLLDNPNMVLWASTDKFNHKEARKFQKRYAKYKVKHAFGPFDHDSDLPSNSFICPVTNGKLAVEGACDKCNLCVLPDRTKKNVVFLSH